MNKIYNPANYKDVLSHIHLSSEQMRERISHYHLTFSTVHNHTVEWRLKLPMFARAFYGYIFKKNDVPTQEEFFDFYISFNQDFFCQSNFGEDIINGLRARAFRTYPSLIRDVIFNKYVQEHIVGYTATYSLELDIIEGIDLMLSNEQKHYAVNLYTDTKRAYIGRAKKQFRHTLFDNVTYIEFPVVFESSHKVGDFFLYGEKEFNTLISQLI